MDALTLAPVFQEEAPLPHKVEQHSERSCRSYQIELDTSHYKALITCTQECTKNENDYSDLLRI
jgi:hypothetical protein